MSHKNGIGNRVYTVFVSLSETSIGNIPSVDGNKEASVRPKGSTTAVSPVFVERRR
jgi:hypothetical protein